MTDFSDIDPEELAVRRAAARTAVTASRNTGDILPRRIYELAGQPAPANATDEIQENPDREFPLFDPPISRPGDRDSTGTPMTDFSDIDPEELAVRRAAARTAVSASRRTGDILPRLAYELAGVPVPDNATDELQPNPDRETPLLY
jgi:hypothetical protein